MSGVSDQAGESPVWIPEVVDKVAQFLPCNDIPCILRLVNKATAKQFASCSTVRLSLPSPHEEFTRRWGAPSALQHRSRKQRLRFLCLTAASGIVENIQVALSSAGLPLSSEVLEAAAAAGQLHVCQLLRQEGCPWGCSLAAAAGSGHRHICAWMLGSGLCAHPEAAYSAARAGYVELMDWLAQLLFADGHPNMNAACLLVAAIKGCDLSVVVRLHGEALAAQEGGAPPLMQGSRRTEMLMAAAGSLTPDGQAKLDWLETLGLPRTYHACAGAATAPDAARRLKWLVARGYPLNDGVAAVAASEGNLAALEYLLEEAGLQPNTTMYSMAAYNGHLAVLKYMHARGAPLLSALVAFSAASKGHLPVVVWALDTLGAVDESTLMLMFERAVGAGDVELMAWLSERGCRWSASNTMNIAMARGYGDVVAWLNERGSSPAAIGSGPLDA